MRRCFDMVANLTPVILDSCELSLCSRNSTPVDFVQPWHVYATIGQLIAEFFLDLSGFIQDEQTCTGTSNQTRRIVTCRPMNRISRGFCVGVRGLWQHIQITSCTN